MADLIGGTNISGLLTVDSNIETDEGDVILDSSNNKIDLGVLPTGSGNGLNADLLDGKHAGAFALDGHNHDGVYILESGDSMSGVLTLSDGSTAASRSWVNSNADVPDADYADSAGDSDTLDGEHASAFANSGHTHDSRYYTESESDSNFAASGHLHDGRYIQDTGEVTNTLAANHGILVTRGSNGLTANNSIESASGDDWIGVDSTSGANGGVLLGYYNAPEVRVGNGNLSDFNWNGDTVATRPWVNNNADVPQADNADTVGGESPSAFANSGHTHDSRYILESGDAMSGGLTLSDGSPAASEQYVSNNAGGIDGTEPIPHPRFSTTGDVPALDVADVVYVDGEDGLYVESDYGGSPDTGETPLQTHINNTNPDGYKIVKNGTDGTGVINFKT